MALKNPEPWRGTSVESSSSDDEFLLPETTRVIEGVLEDIETGDMYRVERLGNSGKVHVRRQPSHTNLSTIRQTAPPALPSSTSAALTQALATPKEGAVTIRDTTSGHRGAMAERRQAEHREMVRQAREKVGDPMVFVADLVQRTLGQDEAASLEEYFDDEFGPAQGIAEPNER